MTKKSAEKEVKEVQTAEEKTEAINDLSMEEIEQLANSEEPEIEITSMEPSMKEAFLSTGAPKTLVKKLAEVMLAVKGIKKSGWNDHQKYHYPTETDVVEKVREELAKRSVIAVPNLEESEEMRELQTRNGKQFVTRVLMSYTFMCADSGEMLKFHFEGRGADSAEKGIYKAYTGAQKYALMKFFLIPTDNDPEKDESFEVTGSKTTGRGTKKGSSTQVGVNRVPQITALFNELAPSTDEKLQLNATLKQKVGAYNKFTDMNAKQQEDALKYLQGLKAERQKAKAQ